MAPPVNVLNVFADDMRWDEVRYMPNVVRLMDRGTHFASMRQPLPMCSPARASFLRGQYATGPDGHGLVVQTMRYSEELRADSLPRWLTDGGVPTVGILGKFFLGISAPRFHDGWTWMRTVRDPNCTDAYGYHIWDGSEKTGPYDEIHQEHYFVEQALDFLLSAQEPWFLWFCATAPHTPLTPTPRNADRWASVRWPLPDSAVDVSTQPSWVRTRPVPSAGHVALMQRVQRDRLRSLADLDDWLGVVLDFLDATGRAERTVVMFWSDNGNALYDHRAKVLAKNSSYDWSMLTPLTVVGPGWPAGVTIDVPCVNPDVTATTLALMDAKPTIPQHGVDLREVVADPAAFADRATLGGLTDRFPELEGRPSCDIVVTADRKLVRFHEPADGWVDPTDRYQLYDLVADPLEMRNLAYDERRAEERAGLEQRLDELLAG